MRDVSIRAFSGVLDAAAGAGVDQATLSSLQDELAQLGAWATWDRWINFLDRVQVDPQIRELGGLRRLGEQFPDMRSLSYLTRILAFVASPELIYLAAGRWSGQSLFPEVECNTAELGDGRLRQTLRVPQEWQDSFGFFELMWGALVTAPRLMALSDSHVEMECSGSSATYTIVPPPSMSVVGRFTRALRTVRSGADHEAITLFSHMVERLQQGNRDVQALWERAEARNDELREALAENERVTRALAKAREELEFTIQERDAGDPLLGRVRALCGRELGRELVARVVSFAEAIDSGER